MAQGGRLTVVGIAGGVTEWSFFATPYESTITNTYWGTIEDLHNVADMYRAGQIRPEIERYTMDDALEAYRRLESGELTGRAVVTPHPSSLPPRGFAHESVRTGAGCLVLVDRPGTRRPGGRAPEAPRD